MDGWMDVGPTTAFYDSRCCLNRESKRVRGRGRTLSHTLERNESGLDCRRWNGTERNFDTYYMQLAGWLTDRLYRQTDKWNAILNLLVAFCRNPTQPKRNRQRSRTGGGIGRGIGRGGGRGTDYIYYIFPFSSTNHRNSRGTHVGQVIDQVLGNKVARWKDKTRQIDEMDKRDKTDKTGQDGQPSSQMHRQDR